MADPFTNEWASVVNTPVHQFRSIPFQEVADWADSWELDQDTKVVVRFTHTDGRIQEKSFSSYAKAEAAIKRHDGEYLAYDSDYLTSEALVEE
jgi:hypothetical protein